MSAIETYERELDNEIYCFANYKCSMMPELKERAIRLLAWFRQGVMTIAQVEERLGELQLEHMEELQ